MANNRMYLVCSECPDDPFFVAKYYPSQGWYINRDDVRSLHFGLDLDAWFDKHKHGSPFGEEICLVMETLPLVRSVIEKLSGGAHD